MKPIAVKPIPCRRARIYLLALAVILIMDTCRAGAQSPGPLPSEGSRQAVQVDEMVVTAEKRKENLQDVPASIAAFSAADIQDAGLTDIQGLSRLVPNLYIANWGIRGTSYAFVRGIGSVNNEPALGFYVDGVGYMDARSFDTNLFDIERIEVLRGPQGTLYGRNALAGVINIITQKPDNTTRSGLEYTLGNYNLHRGSAYIRTPLSKDRLFMGLSVNGESRDGYFDNTFLNRDVDSRRSLNGRANLQWLPSDTLDITLGINGEQIRDGAFPLAKLKDLDTDPDVVAYDRHGGYERDALGTHLKLALETPWFNLTSVSAFRDYEDAAFNDQDFTIYPMITSDEHIEDDEFSQEIRFASPDRDSGFQWVVGGYGYVKDKVHNMALDFAPGMYPVPDAVRRQYDSDLTTRGGDIFGQATFGVTQVLSLTAGLRFDYEKAEFDHDNVTTSNGAVLAKTRVNEESSSHAWLPKLQADFRWNPELMTYASVSRGYRSGGFNTAYLDPSDISFEGEYSWNYELGFKSQFLDRRLIINASVFYITLDDQQVVQLLPSADTMIRNAGKSRSTGFELETTAVLTPGLTLDAGMGYTRAEFRDYNDPQSGMDYSGNKAMMSPSCTYHLALTFRRPLVRDWDFFLRPELTGTGAFYWDNANTLRQEDYRLVNLSLGAEHEDCDVLFWAKNLFDTDYRAVAFEFPGSDPVGQAGDPLTFGVTFRYRF